METEFQRLGTKWCTDKVNYHGYSGFYDEILSHRRKDVKKVLEIGIGSPQIMSHMAGYQIGASLRLWAEYFPNAEIYGLDVDPALLINEGRIHSFYCDQSDTHSLAQVIAKIGHNFDLIVDDGSHVAEHQAQTVRMFLPLLAPNGLYVVEDVRWPSPQFRNFPYPYQMREFQVELIPDDRVLLFRKDESKHLRRAIVSYASESFWDPLGRLERACSVIDPQAQLFMFRELPQWSPTHASRPYAFKAYAMKQVAPQTDLLFWFDSPILPLRALDPLWERIERDGYFMATAGNGDNNYQWTADTAYPILFPNLSLEAAREESKKIPQVHAAVIGLNLRSEIGSAFLDRYYRLASETDAFCGPWYDESCGGPGVKGHRHDQTAASLIAYQLGFKLAEFPEPYAYDHATQGTIIVHDRSMRYGREYLEPAGARPRDRQIASKCPSCGSTAISCAGGMRNCNQCGYRWG
jgi:hypothetical protein